MVSDHEFTFGSAMKPTIVQSIMRFDRALYYTAAYFSQNMLPLQSGCASQHVCVFCADLRLKLGGKTTVARRVHGMVKKKKKKWNMRPQEL